MEKYFWIIVTRTNYLGCENFVILHTATDLSFDDVWLFRFQAFEYWNKKIQAIQKSNIQTHELEIQLLRCCTHKIWTNELHNLILTICIVEQNNHFQVAADIQLTFSLNVCWTLMFVYRWKEGIIFHFCLACSDFYTKDFIHSISIDNMIHPINCEHAWTWNLKFSKNFSVPSQAQVLGSTWPLDH